jgi:predicted AlkP superfamily pyrophosphatase or phosphodiesterase
MKKLALCAAAAATAAWSFAADAEAPKPKLVVAISVDQYSADLFAEYRQTYVDGMKRLAQAIVFPSGYQSHAATETCPGHSTILTGSHPARTGIVANDWYDMRVTRGKNGSHGAVEL